MSTRSRYAATRSLAHEIHVWWADTALKARDLIQLRDTLQRNELDRAARFRFAADRDRFIASHGVLRSILAIYLGISPAEVEFSYGAAGKPFLSTPLSFLDLRFSLSHAGSLAMCAVTVGREVGVDVELMDSRFVFESIPEQMFSQEEVQSLRTLSQEQQVDAFYACWTRKEAYIKALGQGMSLPLQSFTVSLTPELPPAILSGAAGVWTLRSFQPRTAYKAALAAPGNQWSLREWCWPGSRGCQSTGTA